MYIDMYMILNPIYMFLKVKRVSATTLSIRQSGPDRTIPLSDVSNVGHIGFRVWGFRLEAKGFLGAAIVPGKE